MTPEECKAILAPHFEALATHLGNLHDRWMDEREYEDFADYVKAATGKVLACFPAATGITLDKRFRLTFGLPGFPFRVQFYATNKAAGWRSVR
jgi:hypothetical protein